MISTRPRRGMALVAVLAVVSLLSILAVATLSVTTRLSQGSALAMRDARLDAAASYALATALIEWRQRGLSSLGTGGSRQFDVAVPGSPVSAAVTVTRLDSELFWIVAEAVAVDDARRRENLVVRLSIPAPIPCRRFSSPGTCRCRGCSLWYATARLGAPQPPLTS